jgi:TetR/AcrR family transcriptional regulator, repressor of fatR-cypB operon
MVGPHNAKQRILDAGLRLFIKQGMHGVPVPDIIKAANSGAGSFYRYFPSKEDLANSIIKDVLTGMLQALKKALNYSKPIRLQVHETFKVMIRYAKENAAGIQFVELHNHSDYINEENKNLLTQIRDTIKSMFLSAAKEGFLRFGDLHLPMAIYNGAYLGMIRGYSEGSFSLSDEEIEWIESACWRAVTR